MIKFLNNIFNCLFKNNKVKCLADSQEIKPENYWKQQSVRKDEPVIPLFDKIAQEENFLLDHHWEHVMTEKEGCDTWRYPWELRKNWPEFAQKEASGSQHFWNREDAVRLQTEVNKILCGVENKSLIYKAEYTPFFLNLELPKEVCQNQIRELAYYKWEAAGRPEGDGSYFWSLAEQELRSKE